MISAVDEVFKALADPTRRSLLDELFDLRVRTEELVAGRTSPPVAAGFEVDLSE